MIGPAWDSLLAKLIVTGATREQALQRAARALAEFEVEGMATALPFHRAVVERPGVRHRPARRPVHASTPAGSRPSSSTTIPPFTGPADGRGDDGRGARVVVEVGGKRLEVSLPAGLAGHGAGPHGGRAAAPKRRAAKKSGPAASGDALASPMQGTIVKVAVEEGQEVEEGDLVVVLEAMKMEQPLNAHRAGTVTGLTRRGRRHRHLRRRPLRDQGLTRRAPRWSVPYGRAATGGAGGAGRSLA